ncbi:hypothetical protein LX32DRAFT_332073 [Colletotrichum zoysiae]|uniref:Uncharacterized protein n=1 Tax=Colletotrichum zoysiae TaxID=1216348 RepID=A0AAD9HLI1_9PEZI|nr:hypothetical protein LX32DRAFT_332073 [Colletotrichum zoysiae]
MKPISVTAFIFALATVASAVNLQQLEDRSPRHGVKTRLRPHRDRGCKGYNRICSRDSECCSQSCNSIIWRCEKDYDSGSDSD